MSPHQPEDGREAMVVWHNHMVVLCGITGRDMRKLLAKAKSDGNAAGQQTPT